MRLTMKAQISNVSASAIQHSCLQLSPPDPPSLGQMAAQTAAKQLIAAMFG